MKNCDYYSTDLEELEIKDYEKLAMIKGKIRNCNYTDCEKCDFVDFDACEDAQKKWWYSEVEVVMGSEALKRAIITADRDPEGEGNRNEQTRDKVLDNAKRIINGARQKEYGKAEDSFGQIAKYWSVYLDKSVSPLDVAIMMNLMKVARLNGAGSLDCFIDMCGYAALGAEMWEALEDDGK